MRISAGAKERTRSRLLAAAERLFREQGFETTSTRDLARAAGIAAGTLFNYFPTKEALALTLLESALERGREAWRAERRRGGGAAEDLFAHVATGLRELEPYRGFLAEVLDAALSPFRSATAEPGGELREELRVRHLETVGGILADHGLDQAAGAVSLHLYWTLYFGVLAFWSHDPSPHQQDTLAVLDQALAMYVASLAGPAPRAGETEEPHV